MTINSSDPFNTLSFSSRERMQDSDPFTSSITPAAAIGFVVVQAQNSLIVEGGGLDQEDDIIQRVVYP